MKKILPILILAAGTLIMSCGNRTARGDISVLDSISLNDTIPAAEIESSHTIDTLPSDRIRIE